MTWRQRLVAICTSPLARRILRPAWRTAGVVFMIHRFKNPDLGVSGMDPSELKRRLAFLRDEGFTFVPLDELILSLGGEARLLPRSVAFTVDDGYRDFLDVGAPVFAEFDCPVTLFLTTGFLDGLCWLWWDQVEAAVHAVDARSLSVRVGHHDFHYEWSSDDGRQAAVWALFERLKRVSDEERRLAIARLIRQVRVTLPAAPPSRCAPLTWDQVRTLEGQGVRMGAHTVTHPILSQTTGEQAAHEIANSIDRLRQEVANPSPVFCYPNGDPMSFGPREVAILETAEVPCAVSTIHAYTLPFTYGQAGIGAIPFRYSVPRFPMPEDWLDFLQIASGLERVKLVLRRRG